MLLVAAPDHPLARKPHINNGDLAGEALLALYVRSEIKPRRDVVVLPLDAPPAYRAVGLAWRPSAPHRQSYRDIAARIRGICKKRLAKEVMVPEAF